MRRRSGFVGSIALLLVLSLFGCKQGEGERCQIDSDCKDGLDCVVEGIEDNKVCRRNAIDAGPDFDAAPTTDATPGPDAPPPVDAGAVDAAAVDAAAIDAAT